MDAVPNDSDTERLQKLRIFQSPMCLITSDKRGMLAVEEETLEQLQEVHLGVNVVAIVGPFRSGKSYLMNRLAQVNSGESGEKLKKRKKSGPFSWMSNYISGGTSHDDTIVEGFTVDNSTVSKTKGIWVWCRIHPTQENQVLVLLDTDGLGDARKGDIQYDNTLLTLAALLSSTLVYNMMGPFNQDVIEKLTFIIQMSRNIKVCDEQTGDKYLDFVSPKFVLCLRDFCAQFEDDKKPVTPDEYLESCLRSKPVSCLEDKKYNRTRECIKQYFTSRKVLTFDRPGSKNVMSTLEEVLDDILSKEFIKDSAKFTSYVYQCEPKMLLDRQIVTGNTLANITRSYVKAMREGSIPCVDDAMTTLSKKENEKAVRDAVEIFRKNMESTQLPVYSSRELLESKYKLQKSILTSLNKRVVFDDDNITEKLAEEEMETISKQIETKNSELLQKVCMKTLEELYQPISYNIRQGRYKVSGGYMIYKRDMSGLVKMFDTDQSKIDHTERQRAMGLFESKVSRDGDQILLDDQQMTKEEKERELHKKDEESLKIRKETHEILTRQLEEQQKRHDREISNMREEQRINAESYANRRQRDNQDLLEESRQENKRLKTEHDRGVIPTVWKNLFS